MQGKVHEIQYTVYFLSKSAQFYIWKIIITADIETMGEIDCITRSSPGTQEDQTSPWLVIVGDPGCPGIARYS